jgi:Asp-tRNA(Asn)/Glu-tRNA(Gln) amidotransferase A subunit family amidase
MNLHASTIQQVSHLLAGRELSSSVLLEDLFDRVDRHDGVLKSFIGLMPNEACRDAAEADRRIAAGKRRGLLDGVVIAIKDNIDLAGVATSAGLQARRRAVADQDAEVVRRLRAAGAVIIGKTNMDEAAMGGTTMNPFFGWTENPWRRGYTAGGSSGGSAAALAGGLCIAALGSDTLGSTRIPASYCGLAAIKPTPGLVSTRGVVPLCYRLDAVGLMARSVTDLGLILDVVAGIDHECPDSIAITGEPCTVEKTSGTSVGLVVDFCGIQVEPSISKLFGQAVAVVRKLGCRMSDIRLEGYDPARGRRAGLLLGEADASVTHAHIIEDDPDSLSPAVRKLMEFGRDVNGARLARAARLVDLTRHQIRSALRSVEVIMTPTTPQTAFPFETPVPVNQGDFTALANLAGCPAITIPMMTEDGLPGGIQFIGRPGGERAQLGLAAAVEAVLPPISSPRLAHAK